MTAREIVLEGGSPWGFRIHGGVDVQQPLRISRVNPGSKSSMKGIREGDIITSINSKTTSEVTNSEAHLLLKNSGETLVLGLNEESRRSSKKRLNAKTEQVKNTEGLLETKAVTTSTTINYNTSDSNDSTHQFSLGKINGVSDSEEPFENPIISQASTLSSNRSSSPSTASVYSDLGGIGIYNSIPDKTAARNHFMKLISPDNVILTNMSDNIGDSSRTACKKRTRINSNNSSQTLLNEMKLPSDKSVLERIQTLEYRVDSPETINKKPKLGQTVKSRSLDDDLDDTVKITELSEVSESEDNKECGIIVEVESDDNSELRKTRLSVQDEQNLRTYLGGLNLATQGESKESYKERKARTRAAIAEHFMPVFQQPRFLDVISEECSDSSGEHPVETNGKRRACVNTKREIVQVRGCKLRETENAQGIAWNTTLVPQTGNAEVVYLDGGSSPSDESDSEDHKDVAKQAIVNQLTPPPTPDYDDNLTFILDTVKVRHYDPEPLRNLCIKKLLTLPFGCDILQELANVSENIQNSRENWQEQYMVTLQKLREYPIRSTDKSLGSSRLLEIIRENKSDTSHDHNFNKISQCSNNHNMFVIKRNLLNAESLPQRRFSLPQDLFERQLDEIREKERQLQNEIEKLEEEKRLVLGKMSPYPKEFDASNYYISKKGDYAVHNDEIFRQKMYEEYMSKIAAIHERKLNKIIKITSPPQIVGSTENLCTIIHPVYIENEFMSKVHERMRKFGLDLDQNREVSPKIEEGENPVPVLVIDGHSLKGAQELPRHLREFVELTKRAAETDEEAQAAHGVWSPGQKSANETKPTDFDQRPLDKDDPIPPVWTPRSAGSSPTTERKEFKSVNFDSPVLGRKHKTEAPANIEVPSGQPPWQAPLTSTEIGLALSSTLDKRLPTSHSAPASGFIEYSTSRLPKAQNPTITLLQKAREGQLPKAASYVQHTDSLHSLRNQDERPALRKPGEVVYQVKNEYASELDTERGAKMTDLSQKRYEIGIGPTTSDGVPLGLRSEVKEANQSKWYRKMYDTIHKQKPDREYVTIRYKQRRARYPYVSGYFSEPEHIPGNFSASYYDSDGGAASDNKYSTLDRRRLDESDKQYVNDHHMSSTLPRPRDRESLHSNVVKHDLDVYRNQPGRIENYVPGRSSISEKEAKEWWDEVMDIFDGHLDQQNRVHAQPKSFINQALKESGYESDSTLIFRRREEAALQLSPTEQREAYKTIQKGGDVPLQGLRKPAPERPKEPEAPTPPPKGRQGLHFLESESPRKYVENEVTIHYKTPIRQEVKESLSEEELSRRQAEHMKRVYEEERRRKYLQVSDSVNNELQDINSRRHTDNFIPSQKSPIPLNRYDDFPVEEPPRIKQRPKSPEPRLIARALYNFVGQSVRELTFRKGDIIYIRRQVDKNWYEGEHNAMIGLFPSNYVEIIPFDGAKSTPRKPYEGQARAKFNFIAQTNLELSLAKGELVVIIRKVDDNWYEGRIGARKGIFPISYVDVLIDPANPPPIHTSNKPVSSPAAHSLLLNGSASGKESMGSHSYTPSLPHQQQLASSYRSKPQQMNGTSYGSLSKSVIHARNPVNQALHIDTHADPVPYRALYKYRPQNEDELELLEGDIVYVLEKCDDGWFVGSSHRTGAFGTFPGNYVERV